MLASQGRDEKKEERAYQRRDEARQGERAGRWFGLLSSTSR